MLTCFGWEGEVQISEETNMTDTVTVSVTANHWHKMEEPLFTKRHWWKSCSQAKKNSFVAWDGYLIVKYENANSTCVCLLLDGLFKARIVCLKIRTGKSAKMTRPILLEVRRRGADKFVAAHCSMHLYWRWPSSPLYPWFLQAGEYCSLYFTRGKYMIFPRKSLFFGKNIFLDVDLGP